RRDPIVYEQGAYAAALDDVQLHAYEQDGFIILPQVFDAEEIQAMRDEIESMSQDPAIHASDEVIREPGGEALRSIFRIHEIGRLMVDLPRDPRLLDVARQILGSEVYIHQSRANMKP